MAPGDQIDGENVSSWRRRQVKPAANELSANINVESLSKSSLGDDIGVSGDRAQINVKKGPPKKKKRNRINIAPLNTPLSRRLQTFSVLWHTISIPAFFCLFLYCIYLGWLSWIFVVLPYFVWMYGFDLHTPTNGKVVYRVRDWMRNFILWELFVNYFPIKVYKTCELERTFTNVLVESEDAPDDEDDLISEDSRTFIDDIFKFLGLKKRLNDTDCTSAEFSSSGNGDLLNTGAPLRYRRVSTGPRYIFGYHPHGVISMGVMGMLATNALRNEPYEPPLKFLKPLFHDPSKGERLFPGIGYIFPLTLTSQFALPFFRDYLLGLGLTSSSAKNIRSIINNGDNSVCIVVGGAQESLLNDMVGDTRVGIGYNAQSDSEDEAAGPEKKLKKQIRLVLAKRKGFVKLAIELGNICLVPTFAFGEADVYKLVTPLPGSWGHSFQHWMKRTFKFTLPFFSARGIFLYDFGFLPYRTPINIVVGRPIYVPSGLLLGQQETWSDTTRKRQSSFTNILKLGKTEKPQTRRHIPQDILDHYHQLYIDELKRIFEDNKEKFGYGDVELILE